MKLKNPKRAKNSDHPYEQATKTFLRRRNPNTGRIEPLDPGVNFFALSLETMGAEILCDFHEYPRDFHVLFRGTEELARNIAATGFFSVQVWRMPGTWVVRHARNARTAKLFGRKWDARARRQTLKWAAEAWLNKMPALAQKWGWDNATTPLCKVNASAL